jgi:hypothetical protein
MTLKSVWSITKETFAEWNAAGLRVSMRRESTGGVSLTWETPH